jgi:hypothetical protein
MNREGMDDRYHFSDWGSCLCGDPDEECPLSDDEHDEEDEI